MRVKIAGLGTCMPGTDVPGRIVTNEEIVKRNPKVELLDAPAFFELYRIYLQTHPELAAGKP